MTPEERQAIIKAAQMKAVTKSNPLLASMPGWLTEFRPGQVDAIHEVVEAFTKTDLVILEAPCGCGKSALAEAVRRLMETKAIYLCSTKSLQEQLRRDFPYAHTIMGKSNYSTEIRDDLTAEDCTAVPKKHECLWCYSPVNGWPSCPYKVAKEMAVRADLAVLNYSYLLTEANNVGRFGEGKKGHLHDFTHGLGVADEADCIEGELMSHVEVAITPGRLRQMEWGFPKKLTVPDSWLEWLQNVLRDVSGKIAVLDSVLHGSAQPDARDIKEHKYLVGLEQRLTGVQRELFEDESSWVYNAGYGVNFKPVWVNQYGTEYLFRHAPKWLLMSATIISPGALVDTIGWKGDVPAVVRVPSSFPVANREVRVYPVANMTRKTKDEETPALLDAIEQIVGMHPGERTLIHTVSYDLTREVATMLQDRTRRPVFTYKNSAERQKALDDYLATEGAIIVAPSLDRGISMDEDKCRVNIVAKTPYPNLGDKQVAARVYRTSERGNTWYAMQTVRSICQATGRSTRSESDKSTAYLLDKQFVTFYHRNRHLFPAWWVEALIWKPPDLLEINRDNPQ
jgi:Rad3-related DNA helicase